MATLLETFHKIDNKMDIDYIIGFWQRFRKINDYV